MIAIDVAEANQLLAAAETRLDYLAGITPSEERQLALEATHTGIAKLRAVLGIIEERERARHDHEEDERDEWSPRSAYFDGEYREPVVHRHDSQGYRDAMIDAGRGELLRG